MAEPESVAPGNTHPSAKPSAKPNEKSVTKLFIDVSRETGELIEQEIRLVRAETSQITQATAGIVELLTGAMVTFAGLLVLLYALVVSLDRILQPWPQAGWVSPLIVGVVVTLIGGIAYGKGRSNLEARNLIPRRSVNSLRRDQRLFKEQINERTNGISRNACAP